jgi:hypothetical protein
MLHLVYVGYTDNNERVVIERIGDVSEADINFTRHLLDPVRRGGRR